MQENKELRRIVVNSRQQNLLFPANAIKTSKYSMFNFIPKALLLQFMRIANVYFLVAAVLQSIPFISPLAPFSAISPLALVLTVSLIREMMEDYRKHRNDDSTNEQTTFLYNNYLFQMTQWKDIRVGDLVQILEDQFFPADLLIIRSGDENGVCYVETSNLDGERNLKTKTALKEIQELAIQFKFSELYGELNCDKPNNRVHKFQGHLILNNQSYGVTINNLLLRGTKLKNTKFIVGLIVYTGHDCKIIKNQKSAPYKTTNIEKNVNLIVILILVFQACACILLAFFAANDNSMQNQGEDDYIYESGETPVVKGVLTYFTFFLLLNSMVPISLIISLETLKFFQTTQMENDTHMVSGDDEVFKVLNTLIHEELGRVEYIFTDKTGTLTCNDMVFRGCCIKGIAYTDADLEDIFKSDGILTDNELTDFVQFWLCITICHNVLIDERTQDYQGSSPDEVALVAAAASYGFKFLKRTCNSLFIKVQGQLLIYEVLAEIEFTSDRKRMSLVVRDMQTEKVLIYTKGADNIIWKRLDIVRHPEQQLQLNQFHLKKYCKEGLRTLCLSYKYIDTEYVDNWIKEYNVLQKRSLVELDLVDQLRNHEHQIEQQLILLGVSALEDRLQDQVPETIYDLHEAGIKIWMLTGDKLETAENIGYLCNLLDKNTKLFRVQTEGSQETKERFTKINKKIQLYDKIHKKSNNSKQNVLLQRQLILLREGSSFNSQIRSVHQRITNALSHKTDNPITNIHRTYALIIEGDCISYLLQNKDIQEQFLNIIPKCRTVICCRSTPHQKAEIVQFVKKSIKAVTLAIGDGGNDVNMIQEAHIGVGILGKEGNQAAVCSDYFFCQFKYIWRLLFVHGRWNFYRTSYFVNFFFFKNIVFTFQQFYFAFYSAYSGQTFWEDGYLLNFNTLVTAVAPVYYGTFDQDLRPQVEFIRKQLPRVFKVFKAYKLFGWHSFAKWYVSGLLCSALVYFVTQHVYSDPVIDGSGRVDGLWQLSACCYWSTVLITFMVIFTDSSQYTWLTFLCYGVFSLAIFFPVFTLAWNEFPGEVQHHAYDWLSNTKFYLVVAFNLGIVFLIKYLVNIWQYFEYPTIVQIVLKEWREQPVTIQEVSELIDVEVPLVDMPAQQGSLSQESGNSIRPMPLAIPNNQRHDRQPNS